MQCKKCKNNFDPELNPNDKRCPYCLEPIPQTKVQAQKYAEKPTKKRGFMFYLKVIGFTLLGLGFLGIIVEEEAINNQNEIIQQALNNEIDKEEAAIQLEIIKEEIFEDEAKANILINLAQIYGSIDKPKLATKRYIEALAYIQDDSTDKLVVQAEIALIREDYQAHLDLYTQAYEKSPEDSRILTNLAVFHIDAQDKYTEISDIKKAIFYAEKSHRLYPNETTKENLAIAYAENEEYQKSLEIFDTIDMTLDHPLQITLGIVYLLSEDYKNAKKHLNIAKEHGATEAQIFIDSIEDEEKILQTSQEETHQQSDNSDNTLETENIEKTKTAEKTVTKNDNSPAEEALNLTADLIKQYDVSNGYALICRDKSVRKILDSKVSHKYDCSAQVHTFVVHAEIDDQNRYCIDANNFRGKINQPLSVIPENCQDFQQTETQNANQPVSQEVSATSRLKYLQDLYEQNPENITNLRGLALFHVDFEYNHPEASSKEQAVFYSKKLYKHDPTVEESRAILAMAYFKNEEFQKSVDFFNQIQLSEDSPMFLPLGIAYVQIENLPEAKKYFKLAQANGDRRATELLEIIQPLLEEEKEKKAAESTTTETTPTQNNQHLDFIKTTAQEALELIKDIDVTNGQSMVCADLELAKLLDSKIPRQYNCLAGQESFAITIKIDDQTKYCIDAQGFADEINKPLKFMAQNCQEQEQ